MNCINHPDREREAFCQSCGRPLCSECTRRVGSSVFCEPDLAARLGQIPSPGSAYADPFTASPYSNGTIPPPVVPGTPNPTLAGLLGLIPGVGAMYNGQLVKGLIHIGIFATLCTLASDVHDIFGLLIAGWVFYQVIEAYQTALARRNGQPLPDPLGLNSLGDRIGKGNAWPSSEPPPPSEASYSSYVPPAATEAGYAAPPPPPPPYEAYGAPYGYPPPPPPEAFIPPPENYVSRFPTSAVWMIGLGLFFLIGQTAHGRFLHGALLVPILLIGLGVWTFLQRTAFGHLPQQDSVLYRWQLISAGRRSGLLILVGIVFLLHQLHVARWFSVWPLFLIYFGLWALAERFAIPPAPYPPYSAAQPEASAPAATTNTGTSIVSTSPYRESHDTDTEEGR